MSFVNILIAPDIAPMHFTGWYILNTKLQAMTGYNIHLEIATSSEDQYQLVKEKDIDFIYANPFDAAYFVRELGYQAFARPVGKSVDMTIVSSADRKIQKLEDLNPGATIAMPVNKDIKMIGLRLLEVVDLDESNLNFIETKNYQAATTMVVNGQADAAFILAEGYHNFSTFTRDQLNLLVESSMGVIMHLFLAREKNEATMAISKALINLAGDRNNRWIFESLGVAKGFKPIGKEGTEVVIDIIDTLVD